MNGRNIIIWRQRLSTFRSTLNSFVLFMTLIIFSGACIKSGTVCSSYSLNGGLIQEANNSITETIYLKDAKNSRLKTEVELKVKQGKVHLELLDDKGKPTISAVSTPGKPALVKGYLVTDASGTVKYRITATLAKNIDYSIATDMGTCKKLG